MSQPETFHRGSAEFDRGLGFFDVVYGFAITLLVVNIDPPPAERWRNVHTLLDDGLGNQLLGFLISFIVIAAFWRRNYQLMARIGAVDGGVIVANIVSAGLVVFLPFTTKGISDSELSALPLPTALYATNIALAVLSQMAMFEVARRKGFVIDDDPRAGRWATRMDGLTSVAVFAVSIPVAFLVSADSAKLVWLALVVVGPITGVWSSRVVERTRQQLRSGASGT